MKDLISHLRELRLNGRHRLPSDYERFIAFLIEIVLFTNPGEIDREPTFGAGIRLFIFSAHDDKTDEIIRERIKNSLMKWLDEFIEVEEVHVSREENALIINVNHNIRKTKAHRSLLFRSEL